MESEQYCEMIGDQASLRGAICGIAPPCGDKECEFGFKRNENNCQDTCDCVEDDEIFLMGDIIVREETKPFILQKYQVKSLFTNKPRKNILEIRRSAGQRLFLGQHSAK